MARSEARLFVARNTDDDWRALPMSAQWLYDTLLTQNDLTHAGTIRLSVRRWSRMAEGVTEGDVWAALGVLEDLRFVLVDEDTEELLVRSLLRRDGTWRSRLTLTSAIKSAASIESSRLRAALADEVARIDVSDLNDDKGNRSTVAAMLVELIAALRGPSGGPGEGVSEGVSEALSEGVLEGVRSKPLPKGYRKPLGKPQGVGAGAGAVVQEPCSTAQTPPPSQPQPQTGPVLASGGSWHALVVASRRNAGLDVGPGWSSTPCDAAVRRAADEHETTLDVAWQALVELARDPETQAPGRLTHRLQAVLAEQSRPNLRVVPAAPPPCGRCDETRHVEDDQGRPMRCPTCHPLRRTA